MSSSQLQFAVIGAGNRGMHSFARLLIERPEVHLKCLCDPNLPRMQAQAKELEINPDYYTSISDMLGKEKLDAVVITTPDYLHAENAIEAIKGDVNVLIDKPLATKVKDCQAIIKAAEDNKKIVMMGFNLRCDPTLHKLKQIVDNGDLGKIFMIENREYYGGGRTYMQRWNRNYAQSGGLWIHKGSHDFDIFNWLLDFPKPKAVHAFAGINALNREGIPFELEKGKDVGPTCHECAYLDTCPDANAVDNDAWTGDAHKKDNYSKDLCIYTSEKDVHDNGVAIVEYENGARASHIECFVTSYTNRLYTVMGDRGQAEVDLHNRKILIRPRWSQETLEYNIPAASGGHGGADPVLVDRFIKTIQGKIPNTSTMEHGLLSVAVGEAAEIARREERLVAIKELYDKS